MKVLCLFVQIRDTRKSFSIFHHAAKIKSHKDVDGPQWRRRREHNAFLKGVQHELLIYNTFSAWRVSSTSLFQVFHPLPSSFFHYNMVKEFLNQLLRLENTIKSDSGQRCMIVSCLSIFRAAFLHDRAVSIFIPRRSLDNY